MPAGEDLLEQRKAAQRARRLPQLPARPRKHPQPPGKATYKEVLDELLLVNPHHADRIRERCEALKIDDPDSGSTIQGDWDLGELGLEELPSKMGSLTIQGDLSLQRNQLRSLPASFGSLTVTGHLYLDNNLLSSLPASFGSLCIGGSLTLNRNHILTLPPSFPSLTVGGSVFLMDNPVAQTGAGNLVAQEGAAVLAAAVGSVSEVGQGPDIVYSDPISPGSPELH